MRSLLLVLVPTLVIAQPPSRSSSSSQHDALLRAEDARASTAAELATLRDGLRAASPAVRRVAARGIGRLERAALVPALVALLDDDDSTVRATAALALIPATARGAASDARAAALVHLDGEPNDSAAAALMELVGWTTHADSAQVRASAEAIARQLRRRPALTYDAAHALYGLSRQPAARRALSADAISALVTMLTHRGDGAGGAALSRDGVSTGTARRAAEVRELAGSALFGAQAPQGTLDSAATTLFADPDRLVRGIAVRAATALTDTAAASRVVHRALADDAPSVRYLGVGAYARRFGARRQCGPLVAALDDADLTVQLAAADALGALSGGCERGSSAAARLDALAGTSGGGAWHLPAHALLALATVDPERARRRLPPFVSHSAFFARDYAARVATALRDSATLRRLAMRDRHPNVRTTAIAGLSSVVGHAADGVYVDALRSDDSQLVQTAAQALERSTDPRALPALLAALDRTSALRVETWRDGRLALLERVRALGGAPNVDRVRPYVADFDTTVARVAADVVGAWTGTRPEPTPRPLARQAVPTAAERARLARLRIVLAMASGDTVVLRLFPDDAPTNAARFARTATAGRLDGLTIHRIVPTRFVQGTSPGANEYAGWGPFTRDELWRTNRRGTVGLSTRGRDTGDGQIYVNVGDVFELDHNYTIFAEVVSGIEVVERMQEGAVIRRAIVR